MGEETRRNFILVGSAQALFALQSNVALGQSSPAPVNIVQRPKEEILNNLIARMEFKSALSFSAVFQRLLIERLEASLATLGLGAESAISEVITRTQDVLLKDFGANAAIPTENLRIILESTVLIQNILFAVATDIASGLVTITTDAVHATFEKYCSRYPYCKR